MLEVLLICLQLALGIALPMLLIRQDMARLDRARLARCWNDASLWSAVVAFGPVAVVVHFARSRRSLLGLLLGLGWALLVIGALSAVALLLTLAAGLAGGPLRE
ncbi:MAG TPA: hypothetical protein VIM73_05225 [Polyangiaceae bacterium]